MVSGDSWGEARTNWLEVSGMTISMNLSPRALGQHYLPLLQQELLDLHKQVGPQDEIHYLIPTEKLLLGIVEKKELPPGRQYIPLLLLMERFMEWAQRNRLSVDDVALERGSNIYTDLEQELYLLQLIFCDLQEMLQAHLPSFGHRVYLRGGPSRGAGASLEFTTQLPPEIIEARYFSQPQAYQTHLLHHFGMPYPDRKGLWLGYVRQLQSEWGTQVQVIADRTTQSLIRIHYSGRSRLRQGRRYDEVLEDYSTQLFEGLREKAAAFAWGGFVAGSGLTEKAMRLYHGSPWCEAETEERSERAPLPRRRKTVATKKPNEKNSPVAAHGPS